MTIVLIIPLLNTVSCNVLIITDTGTPSERIFTKVGNLTPMLSKETGTSLLVYGYSILYSIWLTISVYLNPLRYIFCITTLYITIKD